MYVIVPRQAIMEHLTVQNTSHPLVKRLGLEGFLQYAIETVRFTDYETVRMHLMQDLLSQEYEVSSVTLHNAMDLVGQIAQRVFPLLEICLGRAVYMAPTCMHFDSFHAGDLVLRLDI